MRARRADGGFTLIEVLVTVIVLSVLAAIVIISVGGLPERGRSNARQADERTLVNAEEAFFAKQEDEPRVYATEAELLADGMIRSLSTLHDVCLSPDKSAYKVVAQDASCAAVTF